MTDINELRRLVQAATPGPWRIVPVGDRRQKFAVADNEFFSILTVINEGDTTFGIVYDDADAKFIAAVNPATISELLDRLEAAESDGLEQARLLGMSGEREAALLAKLEAAEKERDKYKLAYSLWREKTDWVQEGINSGAISPKYLGWHRADVVSDLLKKAEKERDALRTELKETWHRAAAAENTIKALRAAARHEADCVEACKSELTQLRKDADKFGDGIDWIQRALQAEARIEAMERQGPVASVWRCDNGHLHGSCERTLPMGAKLYIAPGAQPASSVPDGWKLVPIEPTEKK